MSQTTNQDRRSRLTVSLPEDLIEKIRDACYWNRITLVRFTEIAFREFINKLENQRGKPYPPRKSELKTGRPIQ